MTDFIPIRVRLRHPSAVDGVLVARPDVLVVTTLVTGEATSGHSPDGEIIGTWESRTDDTGEALLSLPVQSQAAPNVDASYYHVAAGLASWDIVLGDGLIGSDPIDVDDPSVRAVERAGVVITTGPVGPTGLTGPAGPTGTTGAAGPGVAPGGSTVEVLGKSSTSDYATEWKDPVTDLGLLPKSGGAMTGALVVQAPTTTGHPARVDTTVRVPKANVYRGELADAGLLDRWLAALATSDTTGVRLALCGDSNVDWWGATTRANHWTGILDRILRTTYGRFSSTLYAGYTPFIPVTYPALVTQGTRFHGDTTVNQPTPWVETGTGTITPDYTHGPNMCAGIIPSTKFRTATITADRYTVHCAKGPTSGSVTIQIDGGTIYTVDLGAASDTDGYIWDSFINGPGALTLGPHTVKIGAAAGTLYPGNSTAIVEGITAFPGTYSQGVTVYNFGHFGAAAANGSWTGTALANWSAAIRAIDPDLVLTDLGSNDHAYGVSLATYQAALTTLGTTWKSLAGVRSTQPASVGFCYPVKTNTLTAANIEPWWAAMDTAAASVGAAVIPMGRVMPDGNSPDSLGMTWDYAHPSDRGHRILGEFVARCLIPAKGGVPALIQDTPDDFGFNATGAVLRSPTGTALASFYPSYIQGMTLIQSYFGPIFAATKGGTHVDFAAATTAAIPFAAAPPAGVTEMNLGAGATAYRRDADLTSMTKVRLKANITTAGFAGTILKAQYATNKASPSWIDLNASIALTSTGYVESAFTVPASTGLFGGPGDVLLRLVTSGGNSTTVPAVSYIALEVQ